MRAAERSRRAYEHGARSDDWTKDLTKDEREAIDWAAEKDDDSNSE